MTALAIAVTALVYLALVFGLPFVLDKRSGEPTADALRSAAACTAWMTALLAVVFGVSVGITALWTAALS